MPIDWDNVRCQNRSSHERFGLCDDDKKPEEPAYLSETNDSDMWIATVDNSAQKRLVNFVAIDKCVEIRRENNNLESRCDCLLFYEQTIIFVELKEGRKQWAGGGFQQIAATVKLYEKDGRLDAFTTRKAYVANRKKSLVNYINVAAQERFDENWRMSIHAENVIPID